MSMNSSTNRSIHAHRIAQGVNRELSRALGELEAAARLFPECQSELRQLTYDIDRMQRRVTEITEGIR